MKRIGLIIIGIFICSSLMAQNTTRFSQFNLAKGLLNPGAVGTEAQYSAELLYRYQWLGMDGAPQTIGFVGAWEIIPTMAVGLNFIHDQVGITQTNQISASYGYRLFFNDEQYLAFGANAGVENVNVKYDEVVLNTSEDFAFARGYNRWVFNAAFGMHYSGPRMYAGFSIPKLVQNNFRGIDNGFRMNRFHYYFNSGFYIGEGNYVFNPAIQIKATRNAPVQGDILLRNIFNGTFAFTLGYRSENAVIAGFDFMVANKMRFGYSFNYNIGAIRTYAGTGHELYIATGLPFYYDENKFGRRKYLNRKGAYTREVKRRDRWRNKGRR